MVRVRDRLRFNALTSLIIAYVAGTMSAQSLGVGMLRKPVDVTVKNATAFPVVVGFSKFVGYDEIKDCVEEVFELSAGQSRTYPGIAYGPCFYYATGTDKSIAWGGKYLWIYDGFPTDADGVFAKAFHLDQDGTEGGTREIILSEANAWINDPIGYGSYQSFMGFKSYWYKWKYMVEFVPCGPSEERSLEAVNRTSSSLRIFSSSETYEAGNYSASFASAKSYRVVPQGGKTVFLPRTGLAPDVVDALALSASQETGPLYWHGMEPVRGKPSDFGGVLAPKMAYMPLLKGHKTVMTFTDERAMGVGRYRLMIVNRSSRSIDVDIYYTPYPGDSGHLSRSLAPGDDMIAVSPSASVSWEGEFSVGRKVYTWERRYLTLKDETAYGNCDSVNLTWKEEE
jgi:hypothetical protein